MRKHVEESVATGAAAGRGRGGRFSAGRKREVVMRLLRGRISSPCRGRWGSRRRRASHWRASVSGGGPGGPKEPRDGCPGRRPSSAAGQDRRAADGDRVTVCEVDQLEGQRPFGPAEVDAMSGAQAISTRRRMACSGSAACGTGGPLQRVCEASGDPVPAPCRRRGPVGAAPDELLVAHVRRVLEASPFHGEGYRKVWAKLRVEGRRTSKEGCGG